MPRFGFRHLLAILLLPLAAGCVPTSPDHSYLETAVAETLTALPAPTFEPSPYPTKELFTQSYSLVLDPGMVGTITYADDLGFRTTLDFPEDTASVRTTITLVPELATDPPSGASVTGHAFVLLVMPQGQLSKGFVFPSPVRITTTHDGGLNLADSDLQLLWWSGEQWVDPAEACDPPTEAEEDVQANTLRTWTCHPAAFGLFAISGH